MAVVEDRFEDWILSGKGMQGESYTHRSDDSIYLKLFFEGIDRNFIEGEFKKNRDLEAFGIPCPKALRMVSFGNRSGIVFQRINHKKSFNKACGDNPDLIPLLATKLAEMGKALHQRSAEGSPFPGAVQIYRQLLEKNRIIDEIDANLRVRMKDALDLAAKENQCTFLHGDFHFGNAITDGKEYYFIDLGGFSWGNPKFDIAMFYFVSHYGNEAVCEENYHINVRQVMQFWNEFKRSYYGREVSDGELMKELNPYLLLRTLWILEEVGDFPFVRRLIDIFSMDNPPLEDRTF